MPSLSLASRGWGRTVATSFFRVVALVVALSGVVAAAEHDDAAQAGPRAYPETPSLNNGQMESRQPGTQFRECPQCPEMIVVPTGSFTMMGKSTTDGAPGRHEMTDQGILATKHAVSIGQAFAFGTYDVTRDEYAAFVRETGRPAEAGCYTWQKDVWVNDAKLNWSNPGFAQTHRDPVVCVSRADAEAYVHWLNGKVARPGQSNGDTATGPYRLPRWEEAEYAANGGAASAYYWGDQPSREKANYGEDQCFPCGPARQGKDRWLYTSPVGSFPPNAFGLYDMAGNVWQWTDDCWPKLAPPYTCLWGVARGGSWLDNPEYLRTDAFEGLDRRNRNNAAGFRVARSLN